MGGGGGGRMVGLACDVSILLLGGIFSLVGFGRLDKRRTLKSVTLSTSLS